MGDLCGSRPQLLYFCTSAPGGVAAPKILPRDFLYLYCTVVALVFKK
jgi:hypothetical protein